MAKKDIPIHVVINKNIYQELAQRKTARRMKGESVSFAQLIEEALKK